MAYAIETEDVTRRIGARTVLHQVSLRVPESGIYGFLGPNGAGKTTMIRLLLGLIRADAGSIRVFGQSFSHELLRRIGSLVEVPSLYGHLTACASVLIGFIGLAAYLDRATIWNHESAHTTQFVTVDHDVKLEVLDWGGCGRPIVLIAGLGDTAHVFSRFASALSGHYHVYGITRRGFGASSAPPSGYSADRLGDDVLAVIEALKLTKPVLVGHSLGGEELSSVASRYPDKVAGLVYLDAAYSYAYYDSSRGDFVIDLVELEDKIERLKPGSGLSNPRPLMQELVNSLSGFERVLKQRLQDLDALSVPGAAAAQASTGPGQAQRPGVAAARAIIAGERKYRRIPVPVLAIYALPHDMGAGNPRAAAAEASDIANITGPQAKAFENAVPSARVVHLPHASHYIFQSNEADVIREMTAFIGALPQR